MRKHDVRKWLHAILDLLPVFLIPVFMIYSHRHDVTERTDVEVTYKYQSNEVNSVDDLVEDNIYYFNGDLQFNNFDTTNLNFSLSVYKGYLYAEFDTNVVTIDYEFYDMLNPTYYDINNNTYSITIYGQLVNCTLLDFEDAIFSVNSGLSNFKQFLTTNTILNNISYTDYNVIESVEINDEKSSVMNVFMDDFNNSIDKYFNMGNVFNLNGVYEWFNTNIFGGHAPTIIHSIWNIALYELVMDLLFLLYGLFMWFIDIVENIMNKPFKSIK